MQDHLNDIGDKVRASFEAKNAVRDTALVRSRELIRYCANAIRAIHRHEFEEAQGLLTQATASAQVMIDGLDGYQELYHAGYSQDALKELAEAHITFALVTGQALPDPDAIGVEYAAYLNGLGEAVGEMRRYALDLIRRNEVEKSEHILQTMDDIYSLLVTIDFPDAITRGLRRTTDVTRSILERTRGDLTMTIRQERLQQALHKFEQNVYERQED